jgi:hypothetical protein
MTKARTDANYDEMVITPGGARHKSKVHLIEHDHHVSGKDGVYRKIHTASNTVVKELGKNESGSHATTNSRKALRTPTADAMVTRRAGETPDPISDRWIVYSEWQNQSGTPLSYFNSNWIVPPEPTTDNGQLIYLFNGLENASLDVVLQPVLQWGASPAGGGSYWAITNWYVGAPGSGIAMHSPLIKVNVGDNLQGLMTMTGKTADGEFNYVSEFKGYPKATLKVTDVGELVWATETLECYGLKQFSDYPDTSKTVFDAIEIKLGKADAALKWTSDNLVTDNGQRCVIKSNASPKGVVELWYK